VKLNLNLRIGDFLYFYKTSESFFYLSMRVILFLSGNASVNQILWVKMDTCKLQLLAEVFAG